MEIIDKLNNALQKLGVKDIKELPEDLKWWIDEFTKEYHLKSAATFDYTKKPPVRKPKSVQKLKYYYTTIIQKVSAWIDDQDDNGGEKPQPQNQNNNNNPGDQPGDQSQKQGEEGEPGKKDDPGQKDDPTPQKKKGFWEWLNSQKYAE